MEKRAVNAFFRPRARNSNPPRAIALSPKKSRGPNPVEHFFHQDKDLETACPPDRCRVAEPQRFETRTVQAPASHMERSCRDPEADSNSQIGCREILLAGRRRACGTDMRLGAVTESGRAPRPRFPSRMRLPRHRAGSVPVISPTAPRVRRVAALKLETTRPRMASFSDMKVGIGSALRRIGVHRWKGVEHGNEFRCASEAGSTQSAMGPSGNSQAQA